MKLSTRSALATLALVAMLHAQTPATPATPASTGPTMEQTIDFLRDAFVTVNQEANPANQETNQISAVDQLGLTVEDPHNTKGVRIVAVRSGSFGESIGLHAPEIITEINRKPVNNEADYLSIIQSLLPGNDVVFVVQGTEKGSGHSYVGGTLSGTANIRHDEQAIAADGTCRLSYTTWQQGQESTTKQTKEFNLATLDPLVVTVEKMTDTPPVFSVTTKDKPASVPITLATVYGDHDLATRIAKAYIHAMVLCQKDKPASLF